MLNQLARPFIFVCTIFSLQAACATAVHTKSDHYDGRKFFNPWHNQPPKSFYELLKWQFTSEKAKWPEQMNDNENPNVAESVPRGEIRNTFVNHATQLIQLHEMNILTDPIFDYRASPLSWAGPYRHRLPGVEFNQLPKIHVVLISHNHYDHLSVDSVQKLAEKFDPIFIVPLGNKKLLESAGAKQIIELDWWQKTVVLNGIEIHCVPVQHWSARGLFDRNEALWSGFVVIAYGQKIYFGGDTGYGPHFKETHQRLGAMDLALIPIGAYEPRWFMKDHHMNPDEAVQASLDLGAKLSIGMHFGTFQLTDESADQPMLDLQQALEKYKVPPAKFLSPKNGTTTVLK